MTTIAEIKEALSGMQFQYGPSENSGRVGNFAASARRGKPTRAVLTA